MSTDYVKLHSIPNSKVRPKSTRLTFLYVHSRLHVCTALCSTAKALVTEIKLVWLLKLFTKNTSLLVTVNDVQQLSIRCIFTKTHTFIIHFWNNNDSVNITTEFRFSLHVFVKVCSLISKHYTVSNGVTRQLEFWLRQNQFNSNSNSKLTTINLRLFQLAHVSGVTPV